VNASPDYRDFLNDIVDACGSIIRFVDTLTLDAYLVRSLN
jgi:uncharacterized protein with HEPN domain